MQERKFIHYLVISLKGMAMGAADVVPGVSGGTIAFISGIYEELLTSISAVNFKTLKLLKTDGIKAAWKAINGNFLIALVIGIFISILSLAKLISWLLDNHPILVWSFFFGLVLASILYIGKQITKWNSLVVVGLLAGAGIAYYITTLQPLISENSSPLFLFLAGAIAICAMILPGISGAFILLLMGAYKTVIDSVNDKDFKVIGILALGAIVGLLTFSKILKWLFNNYKNYTLAVLTGFILGSLNKIWPWKKTISVLQDETKLLIPFSEISDLGTLSVFQKQINNFESYDAVMEVSILPIQYSELNNYVDDKLIYATLFMLIGFAIIILLERIANSSEKK